MWVNEAFSVRGEASAIVDASPVRNSGFRAQTATPEHITEYRKTKLANYKVAKKVEFRKELPKLVVGEKKARKEP